MKITFSKTREITRAYAADWRIPSSPIVGEICVQYVLVGSGYVMVGSGKWEAGGGEEEQLRQKSNNPNLKGGEKLEK